MTKLYYAFLKYDNKLKIIWEKQRTVLNGTQMRARVEKGPSSAGTSLYNNIL